MFIETGCLFIDVIHKTHSRVIWVKLRWPYILNICHWGRQESKWIHFCYEWKKNPTILRKDTVFKLRHPAFRHTHKIGWLVGWGSRVTDPGPLRALPCQGLARLNSHTQDNADVCFGFASYYSGPKMPLRKRWLRYLLGRWRHWQPTRPCSWTVTLTPRVLVSEDLEDDEERQALLTIHSGHWS